MTRYIVLGIGALVVALLVGFILLITADIPAPTTKVERTLSDDRFPK